MANRVDPDQTAPIGAVCSVYTLFASILNSSVMLGNYLQQTTSADDIFRCIFFLALNGSIAYYRSDCAPTHIGQRIYFLERMNFSRASGNFCHLLKAYANILTQISTG